MEIEEEPDFEEIKKELRPRYVFVPSLEDRKLVGDLDRVMTVEKSVLEDWTRFSGCSNDHERRRFARVLARKCSRPAFPKDFYPVAHDLQDRLKRKHSKDSEEGATLRNLLEIRITASPSWDESQIDLFFWFIRNDDDDQTVDTGRWDDLRSDWLGLVRPEGRYRNVTGVVVTLKDMTAYDYYYSDPLDLEYLSGRQA